MEDYKRDFIDFLLKTNALKFGEFSLKSKRLSPYFINMGDFNDTDSTAPLGVAYAQSLHSLEGDFSVYGIPEKGIGLCVATSIGFTSLKRNVPWFFTRKDPKTHGEATNLSKEERRKNFILGRAPVDGSNIVLIDDVLTTGGTKYESLDFLRTLVDDPHYLRLAIAVDRQEVGIDGKSAVEEFTEKTKIPVSSIVNAVDIYRYLKEESQHIDFTPFHITRERALKRMVNYLRVYGTAAAREDIDKPLEQRIIESERSVIPACDVETLEQFEALVQATCSLEKIGGYKIGFELGLGYGLSRVVETARKHTQKPLIYDHQKAGTDIPDTGKNFARVCKKAGVDAVIFFPQAGPETERAWIYHALDQGLKVIVGGRMTHPAYAQSEGGWISDAGALEMYRIAARAGVHHFVVPGNKPEVIKTVKELVEAEGVDPVFYAPGFVAQGGKIGEAAQVAGNRWHGIVGRGIYEASDMKQAAEEHTSQL